MGKAELAWWAQWVASTCLALGTSVGTAHKIAALFVDSLELELMRKEGGEALPPELKGGE